MPTSRWLMVALSSCEDVLDRIFDRHDVDALALVDVLQHRRDRRRLAGTGDTGEQDQPLRRQRDVAENLGQVQLLEPLDVARDQTSGDRRLAPRHEKVDAEAVRIVVVVGKVDLAVTVEVGLYCFSSSTSLAIWNIRSTEH